MESEYAFLASTIGGWPTWAVGSAIALGAVLAATHSSRSIFVSSSLTDKNAKKGDNAFTHKPRGFAKFQWTFLVVYYTIMLADWLQGTNMYTLYQSYGVDIGSLFITGFASSAIFGTFVGSFVDTFGRRNGCILFCLLEVVINIFEHYPDFRLLIAGRIMGGISTSLLFSAFESWMVTEHRKRGYPDELLAHTFSLASVGNGLCAVAAGIAAQVASDHLGDIGPFQVAIALTVITLLMVCLWKENYGHESAGGEGGASVSSSSSTVESLKEAMTAIREDGAVWRLGLIQSLFEGAMYTFVFMWVPTLQRVVPKGNLPTGLVFTSFMLCITLGGTIFEILIERGSTSVERISFYANVVATISMIIPMVVGRFEVIFLSFLAFEVSVGVFNPAAGTMRSKYIPGQVMSTVMNLFRVPLNILVVLGTTMGDKYSSTFVFGVCASWFGIAALLQSQLRATGKTSARPLLNSVESLTKQDREEEGKQRRKASKKD